MFASAGYPLGHIRPFTKGSRPFGWEMKHEQRYWLVCCAPSSG